MVTSVSVALCTHNGAAFVRQQLQSIFAQTRLPTEIIISDDASTDGTLREVANALDSLRSTVASPPEVRILQNPVALGVTANFEQALLQCSGELIALCDQDDVWHPSRIEAAVARFDADETLELLGADAVLIDADNAPLNQSLFTALGISRRELGEMHSGRGFDALLRRNLITGATTMVRRRLVALSSPFPSSWVHDEWMAVIAAAVGSIDVVEEPLIDYRQHAGNQIGARKKSLSERRQRLVESRGERYEYLYRRSQVLADRMEALGDAVSARRVIAARQKRDHLGFRRRLPASRPARLLPVLREASSGRYGRYSRGWLDVARDLVQPAS